MKLATAVAYNELDLKEAGNRLAPKRRLARLLALEALIRQRDREHITFSGMLSPLCGETPEDSPS